ncbi:2-oxoacid:acceptor oxidoreductase family protein [Porphyromonas loveana]|uniref:2-oxoglutarate ferredoxin oxidoreductase subunit gamma n=2 Tax=Porphyromonas loveana TaxID=1884669 RepID=A0A2U1FAG8_9PORP|nr:2-oxoacid:acceptor oxidoreductase family protein [Porphyromonas loveana]PVZ09172.1 2-oxoglutarate ferredoxin oxidoreductase subunit gamma [Porphyromonas loveana]
MTYEIVIAGFGGQGVLSMGKILAYSGLMEDKEVSWMPSYGPEQRGGTSNVTVIVSDEQVSSPVVNEYDIVIVLNQPSLDKFEPRVKKGGILVYDPDSIVLKHKRDDIQIYEVDATQESLRMGNQKAFNMIVLGGVLKVAPMVKIESVIKGLKKTLPERHHKLIPMNEQAIQRGMEIIKKID